MNTEPTGFNGIDGTTGAYLPAPSPEEISLAARGVPPGKVDDVLIAKSQGADATFGVPFGVDAADLAQAGWGIVFAHDAAQEVIDALLPLRTLREGQAGVLYKAFTGPAAYRPEERAQTWLGRQGAGLGQAQVEKVPYDLLIVGGPDAIPFRFQYELGVNYAIGRLHFDTPQEYRNYAESVVAAEARAAPQGARHADFFGVCNDDDRATQLSRTMLVEPLADALAGKHADWQVRKILSADATKARLAESLRASPARLFTPSHRMGITAHHTNHRPAQR